MEAKSANKNDDTKSVRSVAKSVRSEATHKSEMAVTT